MECIRSLFFSFLFIDTHNASQSQVNQSYTPDNLPRENKINIFFPYLNLINLANRHQKLDNKNFE